MKYIVDSDFLIYYFKKKEPFYSILVNLLNHEEAVISAITLAEVRGGWDPTQTEQFRPIVYSLFSVIDVTAHIADLAGEQIKKYSQIGKTLATADTIIAATALLNSYCLLTRNLKDYPMPELPIYQLEQ